jgi:hypothetical protein
MKNKLHHMKEISMSQKQNGPVVCGDCSFCEHDVQVQNDDDECQYICTTPIKLPMWAKLDVESLCDSISKTRDASRCQTFIARDDESLLKVGRIVDFFWEGSRVPIAAIIDRVLSGGEVDLTLHMESEVHYAYHGVAECVDSARTKVTRVSKRNPFSASRGWAWRRG